MKYRNRHDRWIGIIVFLLVCCTGCTFRGQDQGMSARVTWTPIVQPTDRPFQGDPEDLSYFGETPVLLIFGSQDPADDTPLNVLNISTDDVYDVSSILPAPVSVWSRPTVAGNKDVYFQVGGVLYILSPGGQTRSIELPYDTDNPAYCNWSWKGQLVCLNNAMTAGFLVDQELHVVEMNLPAEAGIGNEAYYEPYRIGENGMRTILITPEISKFGATAFYKDLDLETLTVQSKQFQINRDLYETFIDNPSMNEFDAMDITRKQGEIDVIGISDGEDKVFLASRVIYHEIYRTGNGARWWTDVYDNKKLDTINFDFEIPLNVEKKSMGDYLITGWLFDPEQGINEQPKVYDLESGKIVVSNLGSLLITEIINFILPYGDNWIAGDTSGVQYYRRTGGWMLTYTFSEEIVDSMGPDSYYTVSQPMEP